MIFIINQDAKSLVVWITAIKFWDSSPPLVKVICTEAAHRQEQSLLPDLFLGQGHWASHGYRVRTSSPV